MRFTSWLMFLAASGIIAVLVASLSLRGERTPGGMLVEAQNLIQEGGYDERRVQDRLDQALAGAAAAHDSDLCTSILITRANLYRDLGAVRKARQDMQTILTLWSPGNRSVQESLVEFDLATGEYELGIERVRRLIGEAPDHGRFLSLSGELNWRIAKRRRKEIDALLEDVFVTDNLERALEISHRIAYHAPEDTLRAAYAYQLRRLFPSSDDPRITEVLILLQAASVNFSASRRDYARSLHYQVDAQAVGALLEIMLGVNHHEEAIDLGRFAFRFKEIWREERPCLSYLKALNQRGHINPAATIAKQGIRSELGLPFGEDYFVEAVDALHLAAVHIKGGSWFALRSAGGLLSVTAESVRLRRYGNCFVALGQVGISLDGIEPLEKAVQRLTSYLSYRTEPFSGARVLGYLQLAELHNLRNDESAEREALSAARLVLDELHEDSRELDPRVLAHVDLSERWERLAELQFGTLHGGYAQPLDNLARAIEVAPERAYELLERWEEIGATYLKILGMNIEFQIRTLRDRDDWLPVRATGPFEVYSFAKAYLDVWQEPFGVATACKRLLADYPDFLPALDMGIDAGLELEKYDDVAEYLIRRTELIGTDDRARILLRGIPESYFGGDRHLRLMRADPAGVGRTIIIRQLLAEGEQERALELLQSIDREHLTALQLEILVSLENRVGSAEEDEGGTLGLLTGNEPTEILRQALRTHLKFETRFRGGPLVDILAPRQLPFLARMELAGDLLTAMQPQEALKLLPPPKDVPSNLRGKLLLAYAVSYTQLDELGKARQSLGRAEAFNAEVSSAIGQLFLTAQERRWHELSAQIENLRRSGFQGTAMQEWVLDVLSSRPSEIPQKPGADFRHAEHLQALAQCAASSYARRPLDPPAYFGEDASDQLTSFLQGTRGSRDPRAALCILFALESDTWRPWALSQLRNMDPDEAGRLWPAFLRAVALERSGWHDQAGELFGKLRLYADEFGPAWRQYLVYRERQLGDPYHPELLAERDRRRSILRENADDPEVLALERSISICNSTNPNLERAEEFARQSLAISSQPASALRQLAYVQRLRGEHRDACRTYAQLFRDDPPEWASQLTNDYVETLQACRDEGQLKHTEYEAALQQLDLALDADPNVALARANLDLSVDQLNPELVVSRAWRRLENYRAFTNAKPLELLAPGSTRKWADFYLSCDPERALRFITEELDLQPDSLAVWETYFHVLEKQWDPVPSYPEMQRIARMLPTAPILRKLAGAAMRVGHPEPEVRAILDQAKELEGAPGTRDGQSYYLYARTLLNRSTDPGERVIEYAEALWKNKEVASATVSIVEIARLYATALLLRDKPGDREEAGSVLQRVMRVEEDPYRRSTVEAMAGLASFDPNGESSGNR